LDEIAPDFTIPEYTGLRMDLSLAIIDKEHALGVGAFGTVYSGELPDGEKVAIKVLNSPGDLAAIRDFRQEIRIQANLHHPSIVQVKALCPAPLMTAFELCAHGNMYSFIHKPGNWPVTWELRLGLMLNVAEGLQYMHDQTVPVAHLDLKSANIAISSLDPSAPVLAKIIDFGSAEYVVEPIKSRKVDPPFWLAPEILVPFPSYSEKVDVYSFAIICWELLTQGDPFSTRNYIAAQEAIIAGERPEIPEFCHEGYKLIIKTCWAQEASARPDWAWVISKFKEIIPLHTQLDKLSRNYDNSISSRSSVVRQKQKRTHSQPLNRKKKNNIITV